MIMRDKETKLLRKVVAVAAIQTGSMKEVMESSMGVVVDTDWLRYLCTKSIFILLI